MLCHFLERICFLARLRVLTVFVIFKISIAPLKNVVIIIVASGHFSFVLNNTSFDSKLNGEWSAAFKTVKLMGCGLVWQATETAGGLLSSLLCVRPFIVFIQSKPFRKWICCCFTMFDAILAAFSTPLGRDFSDFFTSLGRDFSDFFTPLGADKAYSGTLSRREVRRLWAP